MQGLTRFGKERRPIKASVVKALEFEQRLAAGKVYRFQNVEAPRPAPEVYEPVRQTLLKEPRAGRAYRVPGDPYRSEPGA